QHPEDAFPELRGHARAGGAAEEQVWDAIARKPGWSVVRRRFHVRDASGDLRVYDGAAVSPRGRIVGLEVKSGTAPWDPAQRAFDRRVSSLNPASGVGGEKGLVVTG